MAAKERDRKRKTAAVAKRAAKQRAARAPAQYRHGSSRDPFVSLALSPLSPAVCAHRRIVHRMEIDLVPENERSRAVVRKVGARYEGVKKRYMYINGIWRDHESYSLLAVCAHRRIGCRSPHSPSVAKKNTGPTDV